MPGTVCEVFDVRPSRLRRRGTFNRRLDRDIPYYIDPRRLYHSDVSEIQGALGDVVEHFRDVVTLVAHSEKPGDKFWSQAQEELRFKEPQELGLGHGGSATGGSGIGPKIGDGLLQTIDELVEIGLESPHLFTLLPIIEPGIGADRVGDMIGQLIRPKLLRYSERVFSVFRVETKDYTYSTETYALPENPYNSEPVILLPRDILLGLPSYTKGEELLVACHSHDRLREVFNEILQGRISLERIKQSRERIRRRLLEDRELAEETLAAVQDSDPEPYDFDEDPQGEQWHVEEGLELARDHPLHLSLGRDPAPEDVHGVVLEICEEFKQVVEENRGNELLYNDDGSKRPERQVQNLFHIQAQAYCQANDLDLSPEVDAGRGAVDFKFSRGFSCKTLVEMKRASNRRLVHGYETQLSEYQKAEDTDFAIFVVVHYRDNTERIQDLREVAQEARRTENRAPSLIIVKAEEKASASRYSNEDGSEEQSKEAGAESLVTFDRRLAPPPTPPRRG